MNIFVVAGPPGIDKSTNAKELIPVNVPIIDQNLAAYQYKRNGFADYQDLASLRSNQRIKEHLFGQQDFALELNLGFQSHYDYLKSIAYFDRSNQLHLLLFFTDDLRMCMDRARIRHLNGGHEVKPEVIEEMYGSTLRLFAEHKRMFSTIRLIDMTDSYFVEPNQASESLPDWIVNNDLKLHLA